MPTWCSQADRAEHGCACLLLTRYKDAGGKSIETLEAVKHSKATLEAQLNTQRSLIESMRVELAGSKVKDCTQAYPSRECIS